MEILIGLLLLFLVVCLFSDILVMLFCRTVALQLCFWLALQFQAHVAELVLDIGITDRPAFAHLIAFLLLLLVVWHVLHVIGLRVCQGSVGDAEAVALDATRIGLVCAIALAMFVTLSSLTSGKLLLVSWIWLTILAVFVAGLDVCCPSLLGRVAKCFD